MKVLIVEDDHRIAVPIKEDLEHQNYIVDCAADGKTALELAASADYDLILLDLMLPEMDGIEVCQRLRRGGFKGAVMMLTARSSKRDKIEGLDCGADDYIVKPFDIDELEARIRALMRRGPMQLLPELGWRGVAINQSQCTVHFKDQIVDLTPTQYRLMVLFLRHPDRIFNRREIMDRLFSSYETPNESVIKSHMRGLRQKLRQAGIDEDLIETVYGFGYRLKPE